MATSLPTAIYTARPNGIELSLRYGYDVRAAHLRSTVPEGTVWVSTGLGDSVLISQESCLGGTQEDRDIVEAAFVDQAGGCKAEARRRPRTPREPRRAEL
jgi:hypothetical protein